MDDLYGFMVFLVLVGLIAFGCIWQHNQTVKQYVTNGYCQQVVLTENGCSNETVWAKCSTQADVRNLGNAINNQAARLRTLEAVKKRETIWK